MSGLNKPVFTGKIQCPNIECSSGGDDVRSFGIDRHGDVMYVDDCPVCGYDQEHYNDKSSALDVYREWHDDLRDAADDHRLHSRLNGDDR